MWMKPTSAGCKWGSSPIFTVDAYPGEPFKAKVFQVRNAPTTVQNVVTYDVVLMVRNPELKLKPGMTANVSIIIEKKDRRPENSQCRLAIPACPRPWRRK